MSYPLLNETGPPIPGLIGSSEAMEKIYLLIRRVARSNASVLLLGGDRHGQGTCGDGTPPACRSATAAPW